ncbi:MAG: DUF3256 family protein [Muribaculaceae bacterium]|nr:DUF3256 family protein [Muribaculaceae bacterium]
MIFRTLSTMVTGLVALAAAGQVTPQSAFTSAPQKIVATINQNDRLDLLDYHNEGIAKTLVTSLGDSAKIISTTPSTITFSEGEGSTTTFAVLPWKKEQLIMVITTLETPEADSQVRFYTHKWTDVTGQRLPEVTLDQWLKPSAKKEIDQWHRLVKFLTVEATFNPETLILTLTPTPGNYIDRDELDNVKEMLSAPKQFKWTGSKFQPIAQ